jgi:glucose/arabinose dehydrogenase
MRAQGEVVRLRGKRLAGTAIAAAVTMVLLGGTIAYAAVSGPNAAPAAEMLLSKNKPVTASTSGGCCPAKNAVDGSTSTRWASAANKDPSWIFVDLQQVAAISHVRLTWDASCAVNYRIEVSNDHSHWTTVKDVTGGNGGVDDFPNLSANGQYVQVTGTKRCRADASHGYSLQEFEVFGNGDTEPPTTPGQPVVDKLTPTSADLHWAPSTDNVGVVAYDLIKEGQVCGTVPGDQTSGTCTGLSPDFDFGLYIIARDAAGNPSPGSPKTQVHTPKAETEPPTVPGKPAVDKVTPTSADLHWAPSTDNSGTIAVYNVYNIEGGKHDKVGTSGDGTPSASVDALTPDTDYNFVVTAVDPSKNESADSPPTGVFHTPKETTCSGMPFCAENQIATDNDVVWGMVTLPDGTILYARRDAHEIEALNPTTGAKRLVGTVPNASSTNGEGGVMGLEINPRSFAQDHFLYVMHTSPNDNRVVRFEYSGGALTNEKVLLSGIKRNTFHNGGRLRFSPDGKFLFVAAGDAHSGANAQNLSNLNGKILRINPDGSIPSDNPFGNAIWSYGHRNPQGLAFDSQGRLWEQEFGDSKLDETNLIQKGGNYGWPGCEGTVSHPTDGKPCGSPGFIAPKHTYTVGSGSCSGIAIIRNILYIACEKGTRLYRAEITAGGSMNNTQSFFVGTFGRLRTVEPTPDGNMWMATSNGGDKDSTPNNSNNRIFKVILGT